MKTILSTAAIIAAIGLCVDRLACVADAAPAASSCAIIHHVFDAEGNGSEACRVAACESSLDPWATNGQYLGLFQLGQWARSRFLRGAWFSPWENARAALRLYRSNRHSWSGQWSCAWAA